ncbi:YjjG family noncanonical pyrimidine nucleotidase [Sinomicrobium kalidii]|uniref:YjjG family noncanonical pyrimidine nucleotidase n=1 Tax=Sinomicrobium kalidii TaxID=2900738 RepID=UPI001E513E99|nr:YjjG family noncanonical pyrimidine nucleotidase [Sinomicrobium kalidii]UGU17115.1 YjjG family noncanonical pyrimidine nucleotidase [Sinomicrobium kalidii]
MSQNNHWKDNSKITDVFFDLDHTLWDFERNSALAFTRILKEYRLGIPPADFLEVYTPVNRQYWKKYREGKITQEELRRQRLHYTFVALGRPVENELVDKLAEDYIRYLPDYNHLFNHTEDILTYLKPRYRLHIITNGFEQVQDKKLANAGIGTYFIHVVNSETAGVKKPHPAIFKHALEKAGTIPQNAVMIGDDLEADVMGAINTGMSAIHYNTRNEMREDGIVTINNLLEIKNYL